jgi:VWFA-related protein
MYRQIKKLLQICILGISLICLTGLTPYQQADPGAVARITQVDTSEFPKVTVYISVTDASGEPLEISVSQLVLKENGVAVTPDEIGGAGEIGPLTTMLVMDVSGSMNSSDKLQAAKQAARAYVDQVRPSDFAGLLAFNTQIEYVQPLTNDRQALLRAIEALKAKDDTAMYDALAKAIQFLEPTSGRKAVIVLTDGLDNRSKTSPQEVIQMIGPEGLSISTIGLGNPEHSHSALSSLNEPALKALAEQAGGAYGYANDAESLQALYELYGRSMQSEYTITYTSPSKLRDGVNRALSVSIVEGESGGEVGETRSKYNPGGLVPEVAESASTGLFLALLAGLLVLLFVPTLILMILRRGGGKEKSRVKLVDSARPSSKARVKLKD